MDMDGVKIYGMCLERLKYQIARAKERIKDMGIRHAGRILLECYNTGDPDDIIDILELYDVEEKAPDILAGKLDDLAYTVSVMTRETLRFDYTREGHLGLYWILPEGKKHIRGAPACTNSVISRAG